MRPLILLIKKVKARSYGFDWEAGVPINFAEQGIRSIQQASKLRNPESVAATAPSKQLVEMGNQVNNGADHPIAIDDSKKSA
jgi:hypothetical protein